ncbi:MAG TPA: hypothetical protein VJA82_11170 [Sediminibacterium sp.]|uniref:hypothetical protein n=1 Tax=Sediminibacterium sp. TaxID=1917865 RepID=UPI0008CD2BF5|nr:hypothetical protein [Sediminibacterium sp.]MBA4259372.1 hypothetical protein [Chitinophaga sp.]OHC84249.1 MAG: hypothetical protein A2472_12375 [Sphingobacteriia bacterium RIFOXYC2_FULL_35_18]OHC88800.1 MAG: hypothetical protein A2546_02810 [Sphingobacteriia bacterium RIFOXYD2_FULL_35_12]HLD53857.1 hypothetical protein [Sediminibacterium sp.]
MKTIFLHDTNALRILAEGLDFSQLIPKATELGNEAAKKNAVSHFNVLTSMELLRHMDEADPAYTRCLKALILQAHLTVNIGRDGRQTIDFIPPLNPLLTQHYFGNNSGYMKYYYRIMEIVTTATREANPDDWKKVESDVKDIQIIKAQLMFEKKEMRDNFESLSKYINNGEVEWNFTHKRLPKQIELKEDIKRGKMTEIMALSLLRRAHAILGLEFIQPGLDEKFASFKNFYEPMLKMCTLLIQKFLGGFPSLQEADHVAWNTYNDMQFIAGACFVAHRERNNNIRVVLVTNDKGIHLACKGTYMEGNVFTVDDYNAFIYS